MFGYVRILEGELKVSEYKLYKSIYCALCKTMKRYAGVFSTLTLSYDLVFLALLKAETQETGFKVCAGRCGLHPLKKRPVADENAALRYAAGASIVLTYYKLIDDLTDKNTGKRFLKKAAFRRSKKQLKKICKRLAEYKFDILSEKIKQLLSELSDLEAVNSDSADRCADIFGRILSELFSYGEEDENKKEMTSRLGYSIGRIIYLIDVMDDFYDDLKLKSFNPLINAGFSEIPENFILASLYSETEKALASIKYDEFKYKSIYNIFFNILSFGIPAEVDRILNKKIEKNNDQIEKSKIKNNERF